MSTPYRDTSFLASGAGTVGFDAGLRSHMQRVYNYMAGGVALTGALAWFVANNAALANLVFAPGLLRIVLMLAPLGFMLALSFGINRFSTGTTQLLFWAFCATMGLSMGSIFMVYTGESIARAFFITAGTFGAMSLWGYTTKSDLSRFGSFLMMGVIGILLASLVNMGMAYFMGAASPMLSWITSIMGVLIFTGLTAWDTQRIKQSYAEGYGVEANSKLAVMSALTLYLNFINAFTFLLRLVGDRR
jgi:uncharacterized protein